MSLRAPQADRLLAALTGRIPDRVPYFEPLIHSPTLEYVLGRTFDHGLAGFYTTTDLVAYQKAMRTAGTPAKIASEQPRALSTMTVKPEDYVEFCQRAGIDAMYVMLAWTGLDSFSARGEVADWDDLDRLTPPPDPTYMRNHVQRYIDAAKGTGVGVLPALRACIVNTYEALGYENFAIKLYEDRKLVEHLLDRFNDFSVAVAEAIADLDMTFFWLDDDISGTTGLLLSPRMLEELWMPRTERILAPIKARGIPIAMHCCGNLTEVIPLALRLGVQGIHPLQPNCNDIYAIKQQYGDRLCLFGNLDLTGPLAFGTPDEVVAEVREHIERLAPGGRYVLGSSHSITSAVKPENFLAAVEAVHSYGVYDQSSPDGRLLVPGTWDPPQGK